MRDAELPIRDAPLKGVPAAVRREAGVQKLWVLLVPLVAALCVGTPAPASTLKYRLPLEPVRAVAGKPLTVISYGNPADFVAKSHSAEQGTDKPLSSGPMAGVAMAQLWIADGNRLARMNNIVDPAPSIAAKISAGVAAKLKAPATKMLPNQNPDNDSPAELAALAKKNGAILDVETIQWGFEYFDADPNHLKVVYSVRARITDATTGKYVAFVRCDEDSDSNAKTAPTWGQLTANKAALAKQKIAAAAASCVKTFAANLPG
jgi:hypothetical protein